MKKTMFRRIGAMAVAFMLALSLAVPVMAADTATKTLTIENALAGQTYKVYKVLGLEYTPAEKTGDTVTKPATYRYTYDKDNEDLVTALTELVNEGYGTKDVVVDKDTENEKTVTPKGKTKAGDVAGFILDEHASVLAFQLMMKATSSCWPPTISTRPGRRATRA